MFDTKIEIIEKIGERDGYNEMIEVDHCVAILWSQKTESGGRENTYASRIVYDNEIVFTVRYHSIIKAGMWVRYNGKLLRIISTHEEGRRSRLHIKVIKYDVSD